MPNFKVTLRFDYDMTETYRNVSKLLLREENLLIGSEIHDAWTVWPKEYIAGIEAELETKIQEGFQ